MRHCSTCSIHLNASKLTRGRGLVYLLASQSVTLWKRNHHKISKPIYLAFPVSVRSSTSSSDSLSSQVALRRETCLLGPASSHDGRKRSGQTASLFLRLRWAAVILLRTSREWLDFDSGCWRGASEWCSVAALYAGFSDFNATFPQSLVGPCTLASMRCRLPVARSRETWAAPWRSQTSWYFLHLTIFFSCTNCWRWGQTCIFRPLIWP